MSLLLLTDHGSSPQEVLPALWRLPFAVKVRPAQEAPEDPPPPADVVLVDAREDLAGAKNLCRRLRGRTPDQPLIAVFTQGGLITLNTAWRVDDIVLDTTGANELTMRLRMAVTRHVLATPCPERPAEGGPLALDPATRTATLRGQRIELTFTEFEILACLARRPGQIVDHRAMLDHLYAGEPRGSTRALHTHIRRIRRKLGPEHAGLIACVYGVGYRLQHARTGD